MLALGEEWKKMGIIDYLVSSDVLDELKSLWGDRQRKKLIELVSTDF